MRIFVTILTNLRSTLELDLRCAWCGLVARRASHRAVCPQKWELSLGMVEAIDVRPGFNVVAGFASERAAVRTTLRHAGFKLAMVGIAVASCAAPVVKMIRHDVAGPARGARLVAIITSHRHVRAGEAKPRVAMLGNRKRRPMKVLDGVATLATVSVRRRGKLTAVHVLVAVGAQSEFHFVNRVFAGGDVALGALYHRVFSGQWVI